MQANVVMIWTGTLAEQNVKILSSHLPSGAERSSDETIYIMNSFVTMISIGLCIRLPTFVCMANEIKVLDEGIGG
jgi:hypothetical protein